MRRGISIFMVLFFGLWPLSGTLEASDDSRLPACCRRHGAHHCAMAMQMEAMEAQAAASSTPVLQAPMTCPLFPGFVRGASAPAPALVASMAGVPNLLAQARLVVAGRDEARIRPIRTHAGRGPPASKSS
jgi:hypothetical protein